MAAHLADNSKYISSSPGNVFVALFGFYFMLNSSFKADKGNFYNCCVEPAAHTSARRAVDRRVTGSGPRRFSFYTF